MREHAIQILGSSATEERIDFIMRFASKPSVQERARMLTEQYFVRWFAGHFGSWPIELILKVRKAV